MELNTVLPFIQWSGEKIKLHCEAREVYFKERQIWWASFGQNVGHEMNGKNRFFERPVLIIRKFGPIFWAIPITTKIKHDGYHVLFTRDGSSYALSLSHIRLLSSRRLLRYVGTLDEATSARVKAQLKYLLDGTK